MYRVSEEERQRRIEEQIGKTYGYLTIGASLHLYKIYYLDVIH